MPERYGPATRIISGSVTGTPRSRPTGRGGRRRPQRRHPLRAELLEVGGATVEVVDPLAQPGLDLGLVAGDRIPVEVEPVVAVVRALDVRGMRAPRLDDDGVDDEPRDDRPVRVRPDHRLVDELLDHDDHALRRERRLLLAAEQPPDLGVARRRRPLGVDDRDVRLERRHGVDRAVAVGRRDRADQRVRLRQVGLEVASGAGRTAGSWRPAVYRPTIPKWLYSSIARAARRGLALDPAPDRVEPADARVAEPAEHELAGDAAGDHLVVDQVGRQPGERQVALALADDLVARPRTR